MIVLDKITKKHGARVLFEDVSAAFTPGHRYGLTGPNGCGKSTLLKIMMGVEHQTSGKVVLPKRVSYLKQNINEFLNMKVRDVVIMGNERLYRALSERDRLYSGDITDAIGMRLAELEEIVAEENGYVAESDAEALLLHIGIKRESFDREMSEIPTDHQFRVLLCQAIFCKSDALLLDEPTNHLDLESIKWLEDLLHDYEGTLIVVSHDRHFLNTVCTDIADIDYDTIICYSGNYDEMVATKSHIKERIELDNKSKEKKIAQLKEFVAKFGSGTRASQAKSRVKEIDRLNPQEIKKSNIQRPYIRFHPPQKPSGQSVYKISKISKSFNGVPVIKNFSYEIHRGDKIGVIGNNGRGKTTLLQMISGKLKPDSGTITIGHQVEIGYFPQNHSDVIDKSSPCKILEYLTKQNTKLNEQEIRSVLGKLLFSGDEAFKEVTKLSGGETARLILASIMLNEFNTLILDEPNNNLDLEAVSALGWGLDEFKGSAIFASHDRDLLDIAANKIIAFEDDGIHTFDGKFEKYLEKRAATKK